MAVVPYGREQYVAGVKIGGSGDITAAARLWEKRGVGTDSPTPVAVDGKVFLVNFQGPRLGAGSRDGPGTVDDDAPERQRRLLQFARAGRGYALFLPRRTVYVCRITPAGLQVLNETRFDDAFVATPVLVRDRLILRGEKYLWCVDQ